VEFRQEYSHLNRAAAPTARLGHSEQIIKIVYYYCILNLYYIISKVRKTMMQKVEVFGEVPLARFGHTITQGM
jgi:hypothetical protein